MGFVEYHHPVLNKVSGLCLVPVEEVAFRKMVGILIRAKVSKF